MPTGDKDNLFIFFVPIFTLSLLSKIVYDHVAKSDSGEKKTLQRYNSPTVANVFENKFRRVEEKSSDLFPCLLCFRKATKFGDSSEYSDCVQLFGQRVVSEFHFFLQSAKRPRYEFSAPVLRSGFLCGDRAGDKGKLFILFIPLFCLSLFSKIVCSL